MPVDSNSFLIPTNVGMGSDVGVSGPSSGGSGGGTGPVRPPFRGWGPGGPRGPGPGEGRGGGGGPGPLDPYIAGAFGIYGLTRLVNYSGACLRVRRSSDNTELDIGFSGSNIDSTAMLSFVGAGNGFVVNWYDQSGGGRHLTQATAGNQPQIVFNGAYRGDIYFARSSAQFLATSASTTAGLTGITVFSALRTLRNDKNAYILWRHAAGATISEVSEYAPGTGNVSGVMLRPSLDNNTSVVEFEQNPMAYDGYSYAVRWDRTQVAATGENTFWYNGVQQATTASSSGSVTGTFGAGTFSLGWSTSSPNMAVRSFVIYEGAKSNADMLAIGQVLRPNRLSGGFDSYTAGLWGLYGNARLRSAYSGPLMRVRRTSDNTEQDFGTDAYGNLDEVGIAAFVGAGNEGRVRTWYDQSGNGNHLVQTDNAKQPYIYSSNQPWPHVITSASPATNLVSANVSGTPSVFTVLARFVAIRNVTNMNWEQSADYNSSTGAGSNTSGAGLVFEATLTQTSGVNASSNRYTGPVNSGQPAAVIYDRAEAVRNNQAKFYMSGTLQTPDSYAHAGAQPSGNFLARNWYVGGRGATPTIPGGRYRMLAIYESKLSDADILALSVLA